MTLVDRCCLVADRYRAHGSDDCIRIADRLKPDEIRQKTMAAIRSQILGRDKFGHWQVLRKTDTGR
jgi:hypothetical protein